ncbi:hypothetical protein YB2330_002332 [Saitoella coloradoensis]
MTTTRFMPVQFAHPHPPPPPVLPHPNILGVFAKQSRGSGGWVKSRILRFAVLRPKAEEDAHPLTLAIIKSLEIGILNRLRQLGYNPLNSCTGAETTPNSKLFRSSVFYLFETQEHSLEPFNSLTGIKHEQTLPGPDGEPWGDFNIGVFRYSGAGYFSWLDPHAAEIGISPASGRKLPNSNSVYQLPSDYNPAGMPYAPNPWEGDEHVAQLRDISTEFADAFWTLDARGKAIYMPLIKQLFKLSQSFAPLEEPVTASSPVIHCVEEARG